MYTYNVTRITQHMNNDSYVFAILVTLLKPLITLVTAYFSVVALCFVHLFICCYIINQVYVRWRNTVSSKIHINIGTSVLSVYLFTGVDMS